MKHLKPFGAIVMALAVLSASACHETPPDDAFRAFYAAVARNDSAAAWAMFSPRTQKKLTQAIEAARAPGEDAPVEQLLFQKGLLRALREIARIEVLTQARGTAVLRVIDELGAEQQVRMLRVDGQWRVDLDLPSAPPAAQVKTRAAHSPASAPAASPAQAHASP